MRAEAKRGMDLVLFMAAAQHRGHMLLRTKLHTTKKKDFELLTCHVQAGATTINPRPFATLIP